jgi:hypothetical protein
MNAATKKRMIAVAAQQNANSPIPSRVRMT